MKFGLRTPSLKKSIAARFSLERVIRHNVGLKAPKGYGWFTNYKKALYNRVYNRTTFSLWKGFKLLSFLRLKTKVSDDAYITSDSDQYSINIVGIVVNFLALLIVGLFFIGLYNHTIDNYGSYYWTHGAKRNGKIGSAFTSVLMILILLGFEVNLWWLSLMFFGYVSYFFINYFQVLLINIPLICVILSTAFKKVRYTNEVIDSNVEMTDVSTNHQIDENKVDQLVDEYNRLK
jgi:hypothetical protein